MKKRLKKIQTPEQHLSKLNVSDFNENDFIINELKIIFKKKEEFMLWYIKNYFTENEINKHSENILRIFQGVEGDISEIKLKLLSRNYSQ